MKKLILYGCGFPAIIRYIHGLNQRKPEWEVLGFIDDGKYGKQKEFLGCPILGDESSLQGFVDQGCYFSITWLPILLTWKKLPKSLTKLMQSWLR